MQIELAPFGTAPHALLSAGPLQREHSPLLEVGLNPSLIPHCFRLFWLPRFFYVGARSPLCSQAGWEAPSGLRCSDAELCSSGDGPHHCQPSRCAADSPLCCREQKSPGPPCVKQLL